MTRDVQEEWEEGGSVPNTCGELQWGKPSSQLPMMVLGVTSNKGQYIPPKFSLQSFRVIDVVNIVIKPWTDKVAIYVPARIYSLPYDLHEPGVAGWNFHNHITLFPTNRLLYSPDLNPLDYYIWGIVKRKINQQSHNTKYLLKAVSKNEELK